MTRNECGFDVFNRPHYLVIDFRIEPQRGDPRKHDPMGVNGEFEMRLGVNSRVEM